MVLPSDIEPKATEHIEEIISMINRLKDLGNAYEVDGHVLFDVSSFNNYGELSRLDKEELISAAKVSVKKDKAYWLELGHKGASDIFDLEKELLPFLDNPKTYLKKYDKKTQAIFFIKINERNNC